MQNEASLLPLNATDFEKVLEGIDAFALSRVDLELVKNMRDPFLCSVSHLPFLAWGRGVDLWRDSWPEWKKRRITAEIYGMKGLKGTLPGINKYLSYMDAEIYDAVIPPVGIYVTEYSRESLDNWRSQFPELRLYPYAIPGERPTFAIGDGRKTVPGYVGRFFVTENQAARYYGRRATLVEDGIETEIRSFDQLRSWGSDVALGVTTFAIPAEASPIDTVVDHCFVGHSFLSAKNRGRLITIGTDGTFGSGQIPADIESVAPLSIAPERVYERHRARHLEPFMSGAVPSGMGYSFVYSDEAAQYIYDRWRLLDDRKVVVAPVGGMLAPFIGYSYIGLTPFTALLRVKATYRREGLWSYVGHSYVGQMHVGLTTERVNEVGEAIYRSRSLRDQIWFTTATYRPMKINDLSFAAIQPWEGMIPIERTSL